MKYFGLFLVLIVLGLGVLLLVKHSKKEPTYQTPTQSTSTTTSSPMASPTMSYAAGDATIRMNPSSGNQAVNTAFTAALEVTTTQSPFNAVEVKKVMVS